MNLAREVRPEWLDTLPASDPRAQRSRKDLRRVNWIMGALPALRGGLDRVLTDQPAARLVELGAGDGSLIAKIAHQRGKRWPTLQVSLIDLQPVVAKPTVSAIVAAGWQVDVVRADVLDWLCSAPRQSGEVIVANLFMHHFEGARFEALVAGIAARASGFVCCEPLRSRFALAASHMLGALGCNDVTRHDAVLSVHAGFNGREFSRCWPSCPDWSLQEGSVGPFVHRFAARRGKDLQ